MRILQWLLALIFAVTAGLKMGGGQLGGTMFGSLGEVSRVIVVVGEVVLAVWLASGWRGRWSAFMTIVVLSVFMGALVVELGKADPKPCGCLGALAAGSAVRRGLWAMVTTDAMMLMGALFLYYLGGKTGENWE